MSTKKKGKKPRKNKTAKNNDKDWSSQVFKFKNEKEYPRGKNGAFLRYRKNKKTKEVEPVALWNWPEDILSIFNSLGGVWVRGGPIDTRKTSSKYRLLRKKKNQKTKKENTKKKTQKENTQKENTQKEKT